MAEPEDQPEPPGARAPRSVLIQDFADVAVPLAVIRGQFLRRSAWLVPLATRAQRQGEEVVVRVGPAWAPESVGREVRVTVGLVHFRGMSVVVPMTWEAVSHRTWFPLLDGEIEVSPLGPGESRLTLSGSYAPPGGMFGRGIDRALMHRVATSTVRSFLNHVANSLLQPSADEPSDELVDPGQEPEPGGTAT